MERYAKVAFEINPDATYLLLLTCLKYDGPRPRRAASPVVAVNVVEEPNLLDDAIQEADSDDSLDETSSPTIVDEYRTLGDISVDERAANPRSAFRNVNPTLNMKDAAFATPAKYFLHFLPVDHLRDVVIPAINREAISQEPSWTPLDWNEYLTWVMLWIKMTIIACRDKSICWRKSSCPYYLNMVLFLFQQDPLYQVRSFLTAFNGHLATTMESGKYMCVDETMNQWLGEGLPNLKKAPRRPHSIGQEYKTIADNVTCIILR
ncbi:hypothetical protein MUCCIDRAFT_104474 [Mucor lusitanicus CBS 277.49]|uniref:PiggyBac transposable element-derived protein domain-containing protein n=1 Tax=Mucor lusitanicus CBS 277.49 TaxID=747725 RepID=A0A162RNE9_MUCCL|nr:hypothetical protein MUCCIDRAFT_104474 [Mucor lusitanicus CBS 277.49]